MPLLAIPSQPVPDKRDAARLAQAIDAAACDPILLDDAARRLIDEWQRDFPLEPAPYAIVARSLDLTERDVLARLGRLLAVGVVSRIGAVVRPNTAGASTLAALAVPHDRLEAVAAIVNAEPGVNHNYEREHAYNLWFVVTGPDRSAIDATLARIEASTGLCVLDLPLRRAFHIDLGFPVFGGPPPARRDPPSIPENGPISQSDRRLLVAIEDGLPLASRPFRTVAAELGRAEAEVLADLRRLRDEGVIARFGLVIRHRPLGFAANAMTVWDVADGCIAQVADRFTAHPFVTLCYERPRRGAHWPYNLFAMIHGRDRSDVERQVALLAAEPGVQERPRATLFSTRCFRQRGARLSAA